MQYLGGKYRMRKWVAKHVIARTQYRGDTNGIYVEPFVGSGAIFRELAPKFRESHANDACVDLMLMWKALSEGWKPPFISDEDARRLKNAPSSPERGFAGFFCAYRGLWFGGYAGVERVGLAMADAVKIGRGFARANFHALHYQELDGLVEKGTTVYCDPPYVDTHQAYGYRQAFNTLEFWSVMDRWYERGAVVVVSETSAPKHWRVLASKTTKMTIGTAEVSPTRFEFLFTR